MQTTSSGRPTQTTISTRRHDRQQQQHQAERGEDGQQRRPRPAAAPARPIRATCLHPDLLAAAAMVVLTPPSDGTQHPCSGRARAGSVDSTRSRKVCCEREPLLTRRSTAGDRSRSASPAGAPNTRGGRSPSGWSSSPAASRSATWPGCATVTDLDTGVGQSGQRGADHARRRRGQPGDRGRADHRARRRARRSAARSRPRAAVTTRMRALPDVASVAAPVRSKDGSALLVAVTMSGDPETASGPGADAARRDRGGAARLPGAAGRRGRRRVAEQGRQRPGRQATSARPPTTACR